MDTRELERFLDWYRQVLVEEGFDIDTDREACDIVDEYIDRVPEG